MICKTCGVYYQGEWGKAFCSDACEDAFKAKRRRKNQRYEAKKKGRVVLPANNLTVTTVNDTYEQAGWRPGTPINSKVFDGMIASGYAPPGMMVELRGTIYRVCGDSAPQELEIVTT